MEGNLACHGDGKPGYYSSALPLMVGGWQHFGLGPKSSVGRR